MGIAEGVGIAPSPLVDIATKPHQMALVVANFVQAGVSRYETTIDFYRATPFAIQKAKANRDVTLEPVVRVDIQTGQFMSLASRLAEITSTIKLLEGET